jgi:DNA-binding transcriptional ArsR family regulator
MATLVEAMPTASPQNASIPVEASSRHHGRMTVSSATTPAAFAVGDADLAALGAALAEPVRARVLLALGDGRALPASVLAAETGVAASTASTHLARLVDAGLLTVRPQGRHRYYALAGPHVGELLEALARLAPAAPVRSLRDGTRAYALRRARTCYDHLAGRLGVALFHALITHGLVSGGDGHHHPDQAHADRLSAPGHDLHYRLTPSGREHLTAFGLVLPAPDAGGDLGLRYCVDWSEQAHHLSGTVGRALTKRLLDLGWLERLPRSRAVRLTPAGEHGLRERFDLALDDAPAPRPRRRRMR